MSMKRTRIALFTVALVTFCLPFGAHSAVPLTKVDPALERRIDALLARMTIEEKVGQLTMFAFGRPTGPARGNATREEQITLIKQGRVGSLIGEGFTIEIPTLTQMALTESRLGIPLLFAMDVLHGYRVIFPTPLAEAAAFDPELAERTAAMSARETAAQGLHWTFAPMIDVGRDARWGRVVEGSGEDPYLNAILGAARVRGFQGAALASEPGRVLATAKHMAAYGAAEAGRDYATVDISESTLNDVYLPPFRAAVDAGVATIMAAFHEIGGVPSSANRALLTGKLRRDWKFRGIVVSDWGSVEELVTHGYARDRRQAAKQALMAGVDIDMCSGTYLTELPKLVRARQVPMRVLNEAVRRVLRIKMGMGLFERPEQVVAAPFDTAAARALAKEAARASMVLLKNKNDLLPLHREAQRTIALVGPFIESRLEHLGAWWADGKADDVISIADAVRKRAGSKTKILQALGTDFRGKNKDIAEAVRIARQADVVVVAAGDPGWNTGENNSKVSLELSLPQRELLAALREVGKPVVLLLMSGGALAIGEQEPFLDAILLTWSSGVEAGEAVAELLFGEHAPSGRLPVTFPRATGQVPIYHARKPSGRPPGTPGGSSYTDSPADPLYPFGHGLTYTRFRYENLTVSPLAAKPGLPIHVSVQLTNEGPRSGTEVVQLYVRDEVASLTRPVKTLRRFTRVALAPGESKQVKFELSDADLGLFLPGGRFVVEPGWFTVFVGPSAAEGQQARFEVGGAQSLSGSILFSNGVMARVGQRQSTFRRTPRL